MTLAKLVVAVEANISQATKGLDQLAVYTQRFAALQARALSNQSAAQGAVDHLASLQAAYDRASAAAAQYARTAAGAFRDVSTGRFVSPDLASGVLRDVESLQKRIATQRELITSNAEVLASDQRRLAGLSDAMARQVSSNAEQQQIVEQLEKRVRSVGPVLDETTGRFTSFGRRGAQALLGVSLAAEQFANGSESGVRRAVRSVESFALLFGEEGLVVSALITGGLALFDFFTKAEREAEHARIKFQQEIDRLQQGGKGLTIESNLADYTSQILEQQGKLQAAQVALLHPAQAMLAANVPVFAKNAFLAGLRQDAATATAAIAELTDKTTKLQASLKAGSFKLPPLELAVGEDVSNLAAQKIAGTVASIHAARLKIDDDLARVNASIAQLGGPGSLAARQSVELKAQLLSAQNRGPKVHLPNLPRLAIQTDTADVEIAVRTAQLATRGYGDLIASLTGVQVQISSVEAQLGRDSGIKNAHDRAVALARDYGNLEQLRTAFDAGNKVLQRQPEQIQYVADVQNLIADIKARGPGVELFSFFTQLNDLKGHGDDLAGIIGGFNALDPATKRAYDSLAAYERQLFKIPPAHKVASTTTRDLAHELQNVATYARGVLSLADAFGTVNQDARRTVSSVVDLVDNLAKIRSARVEIAAGNAPGATDAQKSAGVLAQASQIASLFGAAGAAVSAAVSVGSILKDAFFGIDQAELERIAVTRSNIAALQQNTLKLSGFITNAGNTGDAAKALTALFANPSVVKIIQQNQSHKQTYFQGPAGQGGDLQNQLDALAPFLAQFHLTFAQFSEIAKSYNLTLVDKNGRLLVSALDQMRTGVLDAARAAFTFSKSFNDQKSYSDLRAKLSGETSPFDAAKRAVDLFYNAAPNIAPSSAGLDFHNPAAVALYKKGLLDVLDRVFAGGINPGDFGSFTNLSDFLSGVDNVNSAFDGLTSTVNGVTSSLVNLAPFFKVDQARYNATVPNTLTSASGFNGGLTPLSPSVVPTVTATMTNSGPVSININGANKSPTEIAAEVRKAFQSQALSRFGTTTRWAETQ